jgi:glycosidase
MAAPTIRSIRSQTISVPQQVYPSPANDWQDEVIYFLLPDRFSDGRESNRPLLDRTNKQAARGSSWSWRDWSNSGKGHWQGGRISGATSKVAYLKNLGITVLWLGSVFRQRQELNTYHGYSIQNFLEVDPRLGNKEDLVQLVAACHQQNIRVILDIIFNHSGNNWVYTDEQNVPAYLPFPKQYGFGKWRDGRGSPILAVPANADEGIWPIEFQDPNAYVRAGSGSLDSDGSEDPNDGSVTFRRSDFPPDGLRKFNHYYGLTVADLARCYKYWIGLTDCDGFRIDTMKHVTVEIVRQFTGAIKEYAASIGKTDFFLVGEIAGGDKFEEDYLERIDQHKLNAALDIGSAKGILRGVARGLQRPSDYFRRFTLSPDVGESRKIGSRLVSVLDDHDNITVDKTRFSFSAATDHHVVAGVAIQLFTLTIPCIYYGTEQALSFNGPENDPGYQLEYLSGEGWGNADCFLREAMFGPEHPLVDASHGVSIDPGFPGFGPFGTCGRHCFDEAHPAFVRLAHLMDIRRRYSCLRVGRQYQRPLGQFGWENLDYPAGELIAWSRILDDKEAVIVINGHSAQRRSGRVLIDYNLNPAGSSLTILANTEETAAKAASRSYAGAHPINSKTMVNREPNGPAFVSIEDLGPSEVLILGSVGIA